MVYIQNAWRKSQDYLLFFFIDFCYESNNIRQIWSYSVVLKVYIQAK